MLQHAYVIDSERFAREGGVLEGEIEAKSLDRLSGSLSEGSSLRFHATGCVEDGRPFLSVSVVGHLSVVCQRCLVEMPWPIDLERRFKLVRPGESWPDEEMVDDEVDAIEAEKALDLLKLMEDELLLALPLAPRHEQCDLPAAGTDNADRSPFAVLAALKRH